MLFNRFLFSNVIFPLILTAFPFFNFFSEPIVEPSPASVVCERVSFGGTVVSPTVGTGGVPVHGDFNNDGRLDFAVQTGSVSTLAIYNGLGDGSFAAARVIDTNSQSFSLTTADFNGDGNSDLLTHTKIFFGDGSGNFPQSRLLQLGGGALGYIAGDFNGDDKADIAGTLFSTSSIEVFFGDGSGNFGTVNTVSVPSAAINSFDVADINLDGISDLSAVLAGSAGIAIIPGSRTGFQTPIVTPLGGNGSINFQSSGDVDADGDIDIYAWGFVFSTSPFHVLFRNNGVGGFTVVGNEPDESSDISRLTLADVNRDGKLDVVGSISRGLLAVRFGDNTGAFSAVEEVPAITGVNRIFFDDFSGDGVPDLGMPSGSTNSIGVLINRAPSRLGVDKTFLDNTLIYDTAKGDFNEDGRVDVVTISDSSKVWVAFGNGAGIGSLVTINVTNIPRNVLTGDVNGDGNLDLLVFLETGTAREVAFIYGNGDGTFQAPVQSALPELRTVSGKPALVDFNGDGLLDLAAATPFNINRVLLYQNTGFNSFQGRSAIDSASQVGGVAAGDFDQDGRGDLAILASTVNIHLGNGTFFLPRFNTFPAGFANSYITADDYNGDGITDLAVSTAQVGGTSGTNGKIGLMLGAGKGGFGPPVEFVSPRGARTAVAGDFDGDGFTDVATATIGPFAGNDGRVALLFGNGQGFYPREGTAVIGLSPRGLVAADFDLDGKTDLLTSDFGLGLFTVAYNRCLTAPASSLPAINTPADATIVEGDSTDTTTNVTVSLSAASTVPVRVGYYTAPFPGINSFAGEELREAAAFVDYVRTAGEITFLPGETSKSIPVVVKADVIDEYEEQFALYVFNGRNGAAVNRRTLFTIQDNDNPPTISVGNTTAAEGNSGTTPFSFPLTLSAPSGKPISVAYNSGGGTATATVDYQRAEGIVNIQPGLVAASIPVSVIGETAVEPDETFLVDLTDPVNAVIDAGRATGTITNDDNGGTVQFSAANYTVNDSTSTVTVGITRTGGTGSGVSVRFRTQAGTAEPGRDYSDVLTTVFFGANETLKNINIPINVDQVDEVDETVNLILDSPSGVVIGNPSNAVLTIQDQDIEPTITITDGNVTEGDNGNTVLKFLIRLSAPSQRPISVDFATADSTATAGLDYAAVSGTATLPPGVTRRTLSVTVFGDFLFEPDEVVFLNLTNSVNAVITDNQGAGRIINDEVATTTRTTAVSVVPSGASTGNSDSLQGAVSADGNIIAFESFASNLTPTPDLNGQRDVFVRNMRTGVTRLVSINLSGTSSGDCDSRQPYISADGRFVAFSSCSTNLVSPPVTTTAIFIRDLDTNQTRLVSVNLAGNSVEGEIADLSPDGRFVAYQSRAQGVTNVPDTQTFRDVFVRDMQTNTTRLASVNPANNEPGNGDSGSGTLVIRKAQISGDGRFVMFPSVATNLVAATSTGNINMFVRDVVGQTTIPVSSNLANTQMVGSTEKFCLSTDGRFAFFSTSATGLSPTDTTNNLDVYRREIGNNTVALVSANNAGSASGNGDSNTPYCSADGRYVAFESGASNLAATPDTNGSLDVYWRDMTAGTNQLISVNGTGNNSGNGFSSVKSISANGQVIVFSTISSDMLENGADANGMFDVYVRDLVTNRSNLASVNYLGTTAGNVATVDGIVSANGEVVVFWSGASNLVPNDANSVGGDVFTFLRRLPAPPLVDFDGDGRTDFSVFRPSDRVWYISNSSDNSFRAVPFGLSTDTPVASDYDGDGKTDIAVFRGGVWYVLYSGNNAFDAITFGQAGDNPVAGDYDGDSKADLAVFRQGVWQIRESSDGNVRTQQFGLPGDTLVPADYDGDSRTDIAVFREGIWYIVQSSDFNVRIQQFGLPGDKTRPGDFDGDGKADLTIFRPSNGAWFVLFSGNGSFLATQFGIATDVPLAADFDGDGKNDISVFRDGLWYVSRSSDQQIVVAQFGIAGDLPIAQ